MVAHQPADSIIVYATSAGQVASDGTGRNGLFTSQFLNNLNDHNLEINEVFRRTGSDVRRASAEQQIPAVYSQFFGVAFLGGQPGQAGIPDRPIVMPFVPPALHDDSIQRDSHFWSAGASVGSSFSLPWLVGTLRVTLAPFPYSFLEAGFEYGMISGVNDVGYNSLYPYANYALFLPFSAAGGWYVGAGGGYLISELDYPTGKVSFNMFAVNFVTGVNIGNILDISYSLRTDFSTVIHKAALGYTYRFR
jgi:hypothetical protein